MYKIDIPRASKTQNHSKQAISNELTIETFQITKTTLYLVNEKNLSPSEPFFVFIFHVNIKKNVTICKKLTFQEVQKHKIVQKKQQIVN